MNRRVRLRIRYERRSGLVGLLALALLIATLLGYLAWGRDEAIASGPRASFDYPQDKPLDYPFDPAQGKARDRPLAASAGMRGYYLTQSTYDGADAAGTDGNGAGVCADGYHFASLWEILDPSHLKYNTDLGRTQADSGQGLPSFSGGWVRTGYDSSTASTPGQGNCNAWTSSDSGHRGTYVYLPRDWAAGQDIHVWEASAPPCNLSGPVWCVADDVGGAPVYLPLILRNSL